LSLDIDRRDIRSERKYGLRMFEPLLEEEAKKGEELRD
jgi:hypothetical protein